MYKDLNTEFTLKRYKNFTKICLYFDVDFNIFEYFPDKVMPTGTNRSVLGLSD